ncbi:hypothetical protein FQN54_009135 [Arachnomyces sp. PD_36]|nr:hypothetical protein FQN54_009135 [Arachnomyces sp. PD_36]
MPGILPMKVIKVGNNSQSRVAQACDRCRSKKIRCDGIRPCCSQCASVGFECKTSDKLSRRAFPRGYTESLEDRVRSLEAEVKELKELLDEKDEKIDVLSKIHSFSPISRKEPSHSPPSVAAESRNGGAHEDKASENGGDESIVQIPESFSSRRNPTFDTPFAGPSSTRAFVDVFTDKLKDQGKLMSSSLSTEALMSTPSVAVSSRNRDLEAEAPPRIVSDQLINIFFQEWAPLYPVVHRPTILKAYEDYVNDPESLSDKPYVVPQLNLIFGIAALSSTSRTNQDPTFFERNWCRAIDLLADNVSITTLQCYILAQIYCSAKADYQSLARYRGLAVSLKKVFWTQYVIDRFSAALTGLPVLLREDDIRVEYPTDVDDEYVTENEYLPTLPGESTRISSALALFAASRILNKVLEKLYPSQSTYEIPMSTVQSLAAELDEWEKNLPQHLRLVFTQDKPSTNITGSRSPLLSMAYYFIRILIHRPVVCFGKPNEISASVLALSDSSKHMIQILELIDERRMSLSFGINRKELIFLSGLGLLWQTMGLKRDCKLAKESQKLLSTVIDLLESELNPAAVEFGKIANLVTPVKGSQGSPSSRPRSKDRNTANATPKAKPTKKQSQSPKSSSSSKIRSEVDRADERSRRSTITNTSPTSDHSVRSSSKSSASSSTNVESTTSSAPLTGNPDSAVDLRLDYLNLDYLQFNPVGQATDGPEMSKPGLTTEDWEHVLGDLDHGRLNIFNGIYGGSGCGDDSNTLSAINAAFPTPQSQQQFQPSPLSQQRTQSTSHSIAPSSLNDLQDWFPDDSWCSPVHSNDLQQHLASGLSSASTQSVLSYSDGSVEDLTAHPGLSSSSHGHRQRQNNNNAMGHMRTNRDNGLSVDPFEGIMGPPVSASATREQYGFVDGWGGR